MSTRSGARISPLLAFVLLGCSAFTKGRTRTPECDAVVNRCMKACDNSPEVLLPQAQAEGSDVTRAPQSPCEQRCQNKC